MQNDVENKIDEACNELARVLKEKNKKYSFIRKPRNYLLILQVSKKEALKRC